MASEYVTVRRDALEDAVRTLENVDGVQVSRAIPPMALSDRSRSAVRSLRSVLGWAPTPRAGERDA